jgi:hypothetical protein
MKSTDDNRVANNSMRHTYRKLTDDEKQAVSDIKNMGEVFLGNCDELGSSRELSIAKTKIEEAVFWAVKHVTA